MSFVGSTASDNMATRSDAGFVCVSMPLNTRLLTAASDSLTPAGNRGRSGAATNQTSTTTHNICRVAGRQGSTRVSTAMISTSGIIAKA
ncbi:MAG: hypothetical protein PVI86_02395 [Phycisphaerae bacterium]|jgi:hypothetical protein